MVSIFRSLLSTFLMPNRVVRFSAVLGVGALAVSDIHDYTAAHAQYKSEYSFASSAQSAATRNCGKFPRLVVYVRPEFARQVPIEKILPPDRLKNCAVETSSDAASLGEYAKYADDGYHDVVIFGDKGDGVRKYLFPFYSSGDGGWW